MELCNIKEFSENNYTIGYTEPALTPLDPNKIITIQDVIRIISSLHISVDLNIHPDLEYLC